MHLTKRIVILSVIVALFSSAAFSAEIRPMAGLKGVSVLIEDLSGVSRITKQQLQADVELRLRQSGIKILSEEEKIKTSGQPYICLTINIVKINKMGFAANIHLELKEEVLLLRDLSKKVVVTIWDIGGLAVMPPNQIESIRDYVKDYVGIFCNEYLEANPDSATSKK